MFLLEIEQDLDSFATTGEGGSELNRGEEGEEEGKNAKGTRPGFRLPGGALERMWLAHSLSSRGRVEGRRVRRDEGGGESGRTHGGLKIRPVDVNSYQFQTYRYVDSRFVHLS